MTSGVPSSNPRSHHGRRAGLGLLAGALVAGGVVVGTTASPAVADPPPLTNTVTIESNGTSVSALLYDDAGTATSQLLSGRRCTDTDTAGPNLWVTGAGNGSGFATGIYNGSIGVAEPKSGNGTSCSQVNAPSETLTFSLNASGTRNVVATKAVLDVEVQKDVVVVAQAKLGTANVGGPVRLASGASATDPAPSGTTNCNPGSTSSSSNNNSSDNCRWTITPAGDFDTLVLSTATNSPGQFSIEGGSDWAGGSQARDANGLPANASYFALRDVLNCGESTFTLQTDGTIPQASIRRLGNSDGSTCTGFTYDFFRSGVGQVNFVKPYTKQSEVVQFMMDLKFPITTSELAILPKVDFGFHNIEGEEGTPRPLKWCDTVGYDSTTGLPTGLTTPPTTDLESGADFPGVQFACMATSEVERDGAGKPTFWVQSIYVHGDAYARR